MINSCRLKVDCCRHCLDNELNLKVFGWDQLKKHHSDKVALYANPPFPSTGMVGEQTKHIGSNDECYCFTFKNTLVTSDVKVSALFINPGLFSSLHFLLTLLDYKESSQKFVLELFPVDINNKWHSKQRGRISVMLAYMTGPGVGFRGYSPVSFFIVPFYGYPSPTPFFPSSHVQLLTQSCHRIRLRVVSPTDYTFIQVLYFHYLLLSTIGYRFVTTVSDWEYCIYNTWRCWVWKLPFTVVDDHDGHVGLFCFGTPKDSPVL